MKLIDCNRCSLRSAERNVVVPYGPQNAKLMLVGGGADDEDELMVEPFATLKPYLRKLLDNAGIDWKQVYHTLGVKCPRTCPSEPTNPQAWVCRAWLVKEIETVKPQRIIGFGKLASSLLLNKKSLKLKDVLGQSIVVESWNVIPWHSLDHIYQGGKALDRATVDLLRKVSHELV